MKQLVSQTKFVLFDIIKDACTVVLIITLLFFFTPIASAKSIDSLKREILKNGKSTEKKISLYRTLAIELNNIGKGKEAIKAYNEVLKLTKDASLIASTYNEIGNLEADLGNNENALKAYQTALTKTSDKDAALEAVINKNIGALFLSLKNLDEALKYYLQAEKLAIKANDIKTIADIANNKGTVYEQKKQFNKAELSYKQALKFYSEEGINDRISLTYNNLAILYKVQKKLADAAVYYKKSVEFAAKANNKWLTAAIGNNLGNLLSELQNYTESDIELHKALKIEKEIEAKELIHETLENLADNERRRGNHEKAFDYLKQATSAKSNFINLENTKEIARLKEEFDANNKEKKIEILDKEAKINQLTLNKRNNTILGILAFFVFTVLIAVQIFSRYKLQQSSKLKIATAETKNKLQEEKLRISRELHDNIGAQLSFIHGSIQSLAAENQGNEQLQKTQEVTQHTIKELRNTVWLINQQEFSLEELVVKLREYLKPFYNGKLQISVINECDTDYILQPIVATNLFRIIQEIVNNTIKHAEADYLEIKLNANQHKIYLQLVDNGNGFDLSAKPMGYGLKNIQARINTLAGDIDIKTAPAKGTAINMSIPI